MAEQVSEVMAPVAEVMTIKQPRLFTDEELTGLSSWQQIENLIKDVGIPAADLSDLGNGFEILSDRAKDRLISVPFYILDWRFNKGEQSDQFVSVMVMTKGGEKLVVNDGGMGIYRQMVSLTEKLQGGRAVLLVPKGLSRSDYTYVNSNGEDRPASTYRLSLSK